MLVSRRESVKFASKLTLINDQPPLAISFYLKSLFCLRFLLKIGEGTSQEQ